MSEQPTTYDAGGGGSRPLAAIIADLSKPIPDRLLQTKQKGGATLTFYTWMTAQRYLDLYAPGWWSRTIVALSAERVAVVVELTIPTSDHGLVTRAASGDDTEDDDEMDEREQRQRQYGSPTTRAEGQAFKRACARFGLGLYLRDKHNHGGRP